MQARALRVNSPEQDTLIHSLLTRKRHFRVDEDPLLLTYELIESITFRPMEGESHQLQFLEEVLASPTGIFTAKTGAGKTVLKLIEGIMKPNGENLVVMSFLSPLYPQALKLFKKVLDEGFDAHVYPFRFNLQMPLALHS